MSNANAGVYFLRNGRIQLRSVSEGDVPLLLKWFNDPEVRIYLRRIYPLTESEEKEWIKQLLSNKEHNMVFMILVEGRPIGTMGLHSIDYINGTATTAAAIGEKKAWGRSFGRQAKMLLLDYAFNTLNLRKICSHVMSFNRRSVSYLAACGYKVEGIRKKQFFRNGEYHDDIMLAVFREDWNKHHRPFPKKSGKK